MDPADYNMVVKRDRVTDAVAPSGFPDSVEIPERFIRTDEVRASVVVGEEELAAYELPVVDMASLLDPELSASETAKLGSACRDWGFFQVNFWISATYVFNFFVRQLHLLAPEMIVHADDVRSSQTMASTRP